MKRKINPKEVRKDYLTKLENDLEQLGVAFFDPDKGSLNIDSEYLTLVTDITELTSKQLGMHLNAFTQQKMYMRTLVGKMECYVEEARRKYLDKAMPYYKELQPKLAESAKEKLVSQETEVKPFYEEWVDLTQKLSLINKQVENIEDAIFLLSREVTRRTGDFADENRNYNVDKM